MTARERLARLVHFLAEHPAVPAELVPLADDLRAFIDGQGKLDQLLGVTAVRREALSAAFIRLDEMLVGFARTIFPDLTPHRQAQQGGRRRAPSC
jgi:hypothetical protein